MGAALIGLSLDETITLLAVVVMLIIAGMFLDGVSILFISSILLRSWPT